MFNYITHTHVWYTPVLSHAPGRLSDTIKVLCGPAKESALLFPREVLDPLAELGIEPLH